MIDRQDDARNDGSRHRLDKASAGADDTRVLRLGPDHEAADVLHEQNRNPFAAGRLDEVGDFLGALGVDDSAELRSLARLAFDDAALIGNYSHRPTADPAMTTDHFRANRGLKLIELPAVEHTLSICRMS